jgi:hypothetical protein
MPSATQNILLDNADGIGYAVIEMREAGLALSSLTTE